MFVYFYRLKVYVHCKLEQRTQITSCGIDGGMLRNEEKWGEIIIWAFISEQYTKYSAFWLIFGQLKHVATLLSFIGHSSNPPLFSRALVKPSSLFLDTHQCGRAGGLCKLRFFMYFIGFILQGIARTQSPLRTNYALESPAFEAIDGVSLIVSVQWKGLDHGEPPSWSGYLPCQVSMLKYSASLSSPNTVKQPKCSFKLT